MKKLIRLIQSPPELVVTGLVIVALACAFAALFEHRKKTVLDDRVYTVATDHSPPFQVVRADGRVSGAVVEMIERAAERLQIEIRWKAVERGPDDVLGIDPEVDLWPFVMDLPERHERFYIAEPFVAAPYMLISTSPLADLEAPDLDGKRLAFRNIAYFRGLFREKFQRSEAVPMANIDDLILAVCNDEVFASITEMNHLNRFFLSSRASCPERHLYIRGIPGWKVNLSLGSTFANAAVADALRNELGVLAREGELDDLFTEYQPLGSMSGTDTFGQTKSERHNTLTLVVFATLVLLSAGLALRVYTLRNKNRVSLKLASDRHRYLAEMSHELRTPLNGILGMAGLLEDARLSDQERSFLSSIQASGAELLAVINNILDVTKFELGGERPKWEVVEVRTFIDALVRVFAPVLREKNLESAVFVHPDVPRHLSISKGSLRQILVNLLGNAVKFTNEGAIHVVVSIVRFPTGDLHLRLEVIDSGPGIAEGDWHKLFRTFSQTETGLQSNTDGSGLGLEISRRLAAFSGGSLGFDSAVGKGSTFWFDLPCEEAATEPNESESSALRVDGVSRLRGIRVALIGEPGILADSLAERLERGGAEFSLCSSALTDQDSPAGSAGNWAAVLVDFATSGHALKEILRQQAIAGGMSRRPVIALCNGTADWEAAGELGGPGLPRLLKPFSLDEFIPFLSAPENGTKSLSALSSAISEAVHIEIPRQVDTLSQRPPLKVLIGEDNPINQIVIAGIVERLGHVAKVLGDGKAVVQEFERDGDYDIVLLDCNMPTMDGYQAASCLRRIVPDHARLPIVAVTASTPESVREQCLRCGFTDAVGKPISKAIVERVFDDYCSLPAN